MFRNEGMSVKHNPEFTMMELYQAYTDYHGMMDLCEKLISTVAQEVLGTTVITYQGGEIDLTPPWDRITMVDAVKKYTGIDFNDAKNDEEAVKIAEDLGLQLDGKKTKGEILSLIFEEK